MATAAAARRWAEPRRRNGAARGEARRMRNRALHDALREFALEAAAHLTHELQQGAEIPFDVVEEPGGGTILYNYHPLTSEFIEQRGGDLRRLPAFGPAAEALGSGAQNYLRTQAASAVAADSEP